MSKYEILLENPKKFTRLLGLNKESFDLILEKVQKYLDEKKDKSPLSKRGLKSALSTTDQLLLTMVYLKSYPTFFDLGFQFGLSESYASRIFHKYREILHEIIGLKSKKKITLNDCKKLIVDVTVQPIERPVEGQADYYNGSKKTLCKSGATNKC